MRLLEILPNKNFRLTGKLLDKAIPRYAILSHTWENESQEVTFADMVEGSGGDKAGYKKIKFCGDQAARDGLQYFWVDSCCIDKSSSAELQEAITSMFRWYQRASKCYVYLSDVSRIKRKRRDENSHGTWEQGFLESRWFTRGWTLQELLAPTSVQFFTREDKYLGDKQSLEQQIHKITGIPISALRGSALSQFSTNQRLDWAKNRQTTREEDWAYSLLGIFEISMPIMYGEGRENAVRRLRKEIDDDSKDKECLRHLYVTDPRVDKVRIEKSKGGLISDSYSWILENGDFKQWRNGQQSRLLWIKSDPGRGKTMLLCGIVNELKSSTKLEDPEADTLLSHFFFQATDSRINKATALLRGLIHMLVGQQPALISHVRKKYDDVGAQLFRDVNAWSALSEIFADILHDPSLKAAYLIIDALDECEADDLPKLLDLLVHNLSVSPRIKWIVSSRNRYDIGQKLRQDDLRTQLSLEGKENAEQVSRAVGAYIDRIIPELRSIKDDKRLQDQVRETLRRKADGTFLWVALVAQELKKAEHWEIPDVLDEVPSDLESLYSRAVGQIRGLGRKNPELCRRVLSTVATAYRPLNLQELGVVSDLDTVSPGAVKSVATIVSKCDSFLTVKDSKAYIIHQSAQDFLLASPTVFPSGVELVHHTMFSRSLNLLAETLRRDLYDLRAPGFPIDDVKQPNPDPLAFAGYSCVYWVDHLHDWLCGKNAKYGHELQDGGIVDNFMRQKYIYWLEALSLLGSIPEGVLSMSKLEGLLQRESVKSKLKDLVRDARRFILYHKWAVESNPLQVYASALVFSPACSMTRNLYMHEEPKWISTKPAIEDNWSACLQTLEGHRNTVSSITLSHDSKCLVSVSEDGVIKIWDMATGQCRQTIQDDPNPFMHKVVALSHDSKYFASTSSDCTVKVWDTVTGQYQRIFEGHNWSVRSIVFSRDSKYLASSSKDETVKIWDLATGQCLQTLEGHLDKVVSIVFSYDSKYLASASDDKTVKIWDATTGKCHHTLEYHGFVTLIASYDSTFIAPVCHDGIIDIWDVEAGQCRLTLESNCYGYGPIAFSHDLKFLATKSRDHTVKIWNMETGQCSQTLTVGIGSVASMAYSHNPSYLVTGSYDNTIKIWDTAVDQYHQTLEYHRDEVELIAFSHDSTYLVSASRQGIVKIWDTATGKYRQTLEGHHDSVSSMTFSHDSKYLVLASGGRTVTIWDIVTGKRHPILGGDVHSTISMPRFSKHATSVAYSGMVKIWEVVTGQYRQTLKGYGISDLPVAFSHDSKYLALGTGDHKVQIWDTTTGHGHLVNSTVFSHDLKYLASASEDRTVKIWNLATDQCHQTLKCYRGKVNSMAFSYDSKYFASASEFGIVKIWDVALGQCRHTIEGHRYPVDSIVFSHDSKYLASASYDSIKIWNVATGQCRQTIERYSSKTGLIIFSCDSKYLASASYDGIKIWDAATGQCRQTIEGREVRLMAFSHNSTYLASASHGSIIKIWDTATGKGRQTLEGHHDLVSSITFSHDSKYLASASGDHTVKIWDIATGNCRQTVDVNRTLCSISFDPTGLYLRTEMGTINLDIRPTSHIVLTETAPQALCRPGYSVSSDGVWITWNSENILWLPQEYRPSSSAVKGSNVAIGCTSGKVFIIGFAADRLFSS